MPLLQIDLSGKNGLAPNHFAGFSSDTAQPNLVYEAKDGQVAGGVYNPFRQPGYLSPANNTFEALTGLSTTVIGSTIYDANTDNDDTYFAERGTQLWQLTAFDDTSFASIRTISGAIITDLEIYTVNGVKKLFYAYNKSGGGNIGMVDLPATTFNDTWLSATATGGATLSADGDIFMVSGDDGYLYIFDKYEVHKLDGTTSGGTNATLHGDALVFPTHYVSTDALDYRGNMWIAMQTDGVNPNNTGSFIPSICGVYLWDRLTTASRMRDFIPVRGVRNIRKIYLGHDDTVRLICITIDRRVVIKKFNGTSFNTIHELGMSAYPNYRDSVATHSNYTTWLGADGVLYANGVAPTSTSEGIFKIGDLATASITTGAIVPQYANTSTSSLKNSTGLILNYVASGTSLAKRWVMHGIGTSPIGSNNLTQNTGSVYTPVKLMPPLSTVNKIVIYMAPGATSGTTTRGSIAIYFNQSTTAWATKTITSADIAKGYFEIEVNKSYINSVQFKITYPGNVIAVATDFMPYLALVDYQPTNTLK